MKHFYIINKNISSIDHRIEIYTQQLARALKPIFDSVYIITLLSDDKSITVKEKEGITEINIPGPAKTLILTQTQNDRYLRNVYYLLQPYIPADETIVFHFNFLDLKRLGLLFKENYHCTIVTALHFTEWSIELAGDRNRLQEVLTRPGSPKERSIKRSFEEEKELLHTVTDYILVFTGHAYQTLCHVYQIPPGKITVVPYGMKDNRPGLTEQDKKEIRKTYGFGEQDVLIVYHGGLEKINGISYLMEAFKLLVQKSRDVKLIIMGEGDFQSLIIQSTPYWPLITYSGFLPEEKRFELYSVADIGVIPYLYDEIGFTAIEMLMCSVPVLVNQTTALDEIIDDKVNGEHIHLKEENPAESIQEIKQTLGRLTDNKKLTNGYIEKGRETFLTRYTLDMLTKNIREFYLKVLAHPDL